MKILSFAIQSENKYDFLLKRKIDFYLDLICFFPYTTRLGFLIKTFNGKKHRN